MMAMTMETLALRFTGAVVHFLWIGVVLAVVVFLVERLLMRSAAARHGLHLLGMLALALALPVCFMVVDPPVREQRTEPVLVTTGLPAALVTADPEAGGIKPAETGVAMTPSITSGPAEPVAAGPVQEEVTEGILEATDQEGGGSLWLERCAPWVTTIYLTGMLAMMVRLMVGLAGTRRLRRGGDPVESGLWTAGMQKMWATLGVKTKPLLAWSREVAAPVLIGIAKPVVLLPVALASRLTPRQLEAVLAHELAHLRRLDPWAVALQRVAETLLFFHPAVWWMSRRLERAREEACDDLVVAAGCDPADYAEALVRCSELRLERAGLPVQLATRLSATGRGGASLRRRVLRLLGQNDRATVRPGRAGWILGAVALAGVVLAATSGNTEREDLGDFDRQTLSIIDTSGKPVAGARVRFDKHVRVDGRGTYVSVGKEVSDAEGKVSIPEKLLEGQEVRELVLRVEADGYVSRRYGHDLSLTRHHNTGEWMTGVHHGTVFRSVVLLRNGTVTGRVLGPDGKPLAGAPLTITSDCDYEDCWRGSGPAPNCTGYAVSNHLRAISDEDGVFTFEGVPAGELLVYYPWEGPIQGEVDSGKWKQWTHPGQKYPQPPVTDRAWAMALNLTEGATEDHIVVDLSKSSAEVEGQVLDSTGTPVPRASVRAVSRLTNLSNLSWPDSFRSGRATTDANGRFRLHGLPPGTFGILASHEHLKSPKKAVEVELRSEETAQIGLTLIGTLPVEASPHPAESVVREFFKAVEDKDYDRATALGASGEIRQEGLDEMRRSFDWSRMEIAEGQVRGAHGIVLTKPFPASATTRPGQFGFSLIAHGDRWLIRDVDFLPDDKAVEKWRAEFREVEPLARSAEAVEPSPQSDREFVLAYAKALAAGDFETLEQTWEFSDDLDRQFAGKLAEMFAGAEDMSVELVSMQSIGENELFACFLSRNGPDHFGKEPAPHSTIFHRKNGRWHCAPPQYLRTAVQTRSMGVEQIGRRSITQKIIAARFRPDSLAKRIARVRAQRNAFARLAWPPFKLDHFEVIAEQMTANIKKMEAMDADTGKDLWRLMIEEHGEDALPQAGDFYLRFHLAAGKDDPHVTEIPFADKDETFKAEPFPCLIEDHVLRAGVSKEPDGNSSQVDLTLTRGGAKIFGELTGASVRKRLAIVIEDKVVVAPEIMTKIDGGRLSVTGDFSRQEAEAIAKKLNAYREQAAEFIQGIRQEEGEMGRDSEKARPIGRQDQAEVPEQAALPEMVPVVSNAVGVSFDRPVDWIVDQNPPPHTGKGVDFIQPDSFVDLVQASLRVSLVDNGGPTSIDVTSPPDPKATASRILEVDGEPARLTVFKGVGTSELLTVQVAKGTRSYDIRMVFPHKRHEEYLQLALAVCASMKIHEWGGAIDGVMMRITKREFRIPQGGELDLRVDIYNGGTVDRRIALEHEAWELEIDGKWLKVTGGVEGDRLHLPLPAKQAQHQVEVWPWLWENMTAAIKELPPGKHTIRVARLLNGEGRSTKNPSQIRIVSQSVTVEVVAGDEGAGGDRRPADFAEAAERLTAAVGGKWVVAKHERVPGLGRELWCSFAAWHGVHVAYGIIPFPSLDDQGRADLAAFLRTCNEALDVVASDDRWTVVAGVSHEPEVTSKVLQTLGMKMSKEAERRRRASARAECLDFRLAVTTDADVPSAAQIADYKDLMARMGPNGGRHRGDPYLWFSEMDICDAPSAVVRTRDDYLLLSDKPGEVLLSGPARPRPWHLKRVHAGKDSQGRISITLDLDETAARHMRELVRGKGARSLAVLFQNRVLAVVAVHEKQSDRVVLTGGDEGFDTDLADRIVRTLLYAIPVVGEGEAHNPIVPTVKDIIGDTDDLVELASAESGQGAAARLNQIQMSVPEHPGHRLAHGWVSFDELDGEIAIREHVGGGSSLSPITEPLELIFKVEARELALEIEMTRQRDDDKVRVAGKTVIPKGSEMSVLRIDPVHGLTADYQVLWRADFIKDGKTMKSVAYVARLSPVAEDYDGFGRKEMPGVKLAIQETNEANTPWGEAVEGVSARIHAKQAVWNMGEEVVLQADIRNEGQKEWNVAQAQQTCTLEWDGHEYRSRRDLNVKSSHLPPGRRYENIPITISGGENEWRSLIDPPARPSMTPGKHTVRVIFWPESPYDEHNTSRKIRVVSNPVEIEISATKDTAKHIFDRYLKAPYPEGPAATDPYGSPAHVESGKAGKTRSALLEELRAMPEAAVSAAEQVLFHRADPRQRLEIVRMLGGHLHTRECAELLHRVADDVRKPEGRDGILYEELVRSSAVHALRFMARRTDRSGGKRIQNRPDFPEKVPGLVPYLVAAAGDEAERVRVSAIYALADSRDPAAVVEIRNLLKDPSDKVRLLAACFLTEYKDESGLPEMRQALTRFEKTEADSENASEYYNQLEMLLASFERITGESFGEIPLNPTLASIISRHPEGVKRYRQLLDAWKAYFTVEGEREEAESPRKQKHAFSLYQVLGHENAPSFGEPVDSARRRIHFSDGNKGADRFDALRPENYPVEGLILADKPLITTDDLISYDWQQHVMRLKPGVRERVPQSRSVFGEPFAVVVDGKPRYLGTFWGMGSSYSANMPTIPAYRWRQGLPETDPAYLPPNALLIENRQWLRGNELPRDPRRDPHLRRALQQAGKLVGVHGMDEPWGEVVSGVAARLRTERLQYSQDDSPPGIQFDLKNESEDLEVLLGGSGEPTEILIDGDLYQHLENITGRVPICGPGQRAIGATLLLDKRWTADGAPLHLKAGKHTVQAVVHALRRGEHSGKALRVLSNPVEIEITKNEELMGLRDAAPPSQATKSAGPLQPILPILQALKGEVVALAGDYPQLAGAKAVEVKPEEWLFEHDCRFMGKGGYENTGAFPVAIGLKVMTTGRFNELIDKVAMTEPAYRWDYLGLVGWPTLHTSDEIPPVLVGKLREALGKAVVKIGPLNRQALADGLPEAIQTERDRLLAEADRNIRKGVMALADIHPLLKKGKPWDRLGTASGPGRIGIHFRRTHTGKGRTDAKAFPPSEEFGILVVLRLPPDEIAQMGLWPLYPRLGLVGQFGTHAADPALAAALKKLVADALAPLAELEKRASEQDARPAADAPPSQDRRRGWAEAEADLKAGRARYFHIGMLSADSQLADILLEDYGLTLVGLGCTPVPPVGEHAKGYNEIIVHELGKKFGREFIEKAREKDRTLQEQARKRDGAGE